MMVRAALFCCTLLHVLLLGSCNSTADSPPTSHHTRTFSDLGTLLKDKEVFPDAGLPVVVAVGLPEYSWPEIQQQVATLSPAPVTVLALRCNKNDVGVTGPAAGATPISTAQAGGSSQAAASEGGSASSAQVLHQALQSEQSGVALQSEPSGAADPAAWSAVSLLHMQRSLAPPSQGSALARPRHRHLLQGRSALQAGAAPTQQQAEAALPDAGVAPLCMKDMPSMLGKLDAILAATERSNLLVYATAAAPMLKANLVLAGMQRSRHVARLALALVKDGQVGQVTVIDTASEQRTDYRPSSLHSVFQNIYDKRVWGGDGLGSGYGSSMEYTAVLRERLLQLLQELGIKTMVDAPCGGMLWMPHVLQEMEAKAPGFKYYGLDVSCGVIKDAKERFAQHPNWSFVCMDVSEATFPLQKPDLVFSRDALQHIPFRSIHNFLNNVKRHQAKYLLVGSYLNQTLSNRNIEAGDYFPLNLFAAPFNMRPQPLQVIAERTPAFHNDPQKFMVLMDVATMEWDQPPF